MTMCRQRNLRLTDLLAIIIRLFKVENLEIRILDSHGNIKKVNWDEDTITVLVRVIYAVRMRCNSVALTC
jgi:hypothetical protein